MSAEFITSLSYERIKSKMRSIPRGALGNNRNVFSAEISGEMKNVSYHRSKSVAPLAAALA